MSILVDGSTRVVVQGITGSAGSFHPEQMLEYGTQVVAGVTPNRGGTKMAAALAPVSRTACSTVLKMGTLPWNRVPPRPGVTPATTLVP